MALHDDAGELATAELDSDQAILATVIAVAGVIIFLLPPVIAGHIRFARAEAAVSARTRALLDHTRCGRLQSHFGGSLPLSCLATLLLVALATLASTLPILLTGLQPAPGLSSWSHGHAWLGGPSSVQFCEPDFEHSAYIAEPLNCISSLASYSTLALVGLFGPGGSAQARSRGASETVANITLFVIGLGSAALHGLLREVAQAGDELPMLWFVASSSFLMAECIMGELDVATLPARRAGAALVLVVSATATYIYVGVRANFAAFVAMFASLGVVLVGSIVWLAFGFSFSQHGPAGRACLVGVVLPLLLTTGWTIMLAIVCWAAEMGACKLVVEELGLGAGLAPFVFRHVIHCVWHATSALAAYLLLQTARAVRGLQERRGRGKRQGLPSLDWVGAPVVVFGEEVGGLSKLARVQSVRYLVVQPEPKMAAR